MLLLLAGSNGGGQPTLNCCAVADCEEEEETGRLDGSIRPCPQGSDPKGHCILIPIEEGVEGEAGWFKIPTLLLPL